MNLPSSAEPQESLPLWTGGAPGALGQRPEDVPTLTPYLPDAVKATTLADAGLSSARSKGPTVLWGAGTTLVGILWWVAVRRRPHWTTYFGGVLPFLVVLFFFFAHLEQLLPANY